MDFTVNKYKELLVALKKQGFLFIPVNEAKDSAVSKLIILRHDVDKSPKNSLLTANIEHELGIRGTYYFRVVPESYDEHIIKKIQNLGHIIGYHYEDISSIAEKDRRGLKPNALYPTPSALDRAINSFALNLGKLRTLAPVQTICMHGSTYSRWDNRLLWKHYDYRTFGIKAEPYFDFNFSDMLYLTDTGRRWDGASFSIRDKALLIYEEQTLNNGGGKAQVAYRHEDYYNDWKVVPINGSLMRLSKEGFGFQKTHRYRSTSSIIKAVKEGSFPASAMITIHPQRWHDSIIPWSKELIWQNMKNVAKYYIIKMRT